MKQIAAYSAVLSLFVVGVLVGALGTHLYYGHALEDARAIHQRERWRSDDRRFGFRPDDPHGRMPAPLRFDLFLDPQLDLSPEQQREIEQIVRRSRERGEQLRRELGPQVRSLMEATLEQIEQVLTPAQREQFTRLREQHRERAERLLPRSRSIGGSEGERRRPPRRPPQPAEDGGG